MTIPIARDCELTNAFLASAGCADAVRHPIAGDASARHYQRLARRDQPSVILAETPYPDVDLIPFVEIGQVLARLGFSVPRVLAVAPELGLMLLEDFGDGTFSRHLNQGCDPVQLYGLAIDVLAELHARFQPGDAEGLNLPLYDAERFIDQVMLFADAYVPLALGRPLQHTERSQLEQAWWQVVPEACRVPPTLMLRDFHVDNLMVLPRPGLAACGLLDFQSAGLGPPIYDVLSLLEDARRDVADDVKGAMTERYLSKWMPRTVEAELSAWAVLAAVRHARVIGIFTRIAVTQGRRTYLVHLPRVWRLLERHLDHPTLAPVSAWFHDLLPPDRRAPFEIPDGPIATAELMP